MRYLLVRLLLFGCCTLLMWQTLDAQVPTLTLDVPQEGFVGEEVCFPITFENTGATGYGPYVRLIVPSGATFNSSRFAGGVQTVQNLGQIVSFPPNNFVIDPLARNDNSDSANDTIFAPIGSHIILLEYPVSSVEAGGVTLSSEVCLTLGNSVALGNPLDLCVQGGYQFGRTPTRYDGEIIGAAVCDQLTPIAFRFSKTVNGAEEPLTVTPGGNGDNCNTFQYALNLDIAAGANLSGPITFSDVLPTEITYLGNLSVPSGCSATTEPVMGGAGGTLTVSCSGSFAGSAAAADMVVSFDATVGDALDKTSCADESISNMATINVAGSPQQGDAVVVQAQHLELTHANNAPGSVSIGQTVSYTVGANINEFTAGLTAASITFLVPDGMVFLSSSLTLDGSPVSSSNVTVAAGPGTGATVTVDVRAEKGADFLPCEPIALSYQANVNRTYGNGDNVLANDTLNNSSSMTYSLSEGAMGCVANAETSINLIGTSIQKTINNSPPTGADRNGQWWPGDEVEYRLEARIPSLDADNLVITDFFPSAIHDVTDLSTTFGTDVRFSPASCWTNNPVSYTIDATTNSLVMDFGDVSDAITGGCVDIVLNITIPIIEEPFANGVFHSNFMRMSTDDSDGETNTEERLTLLQVAAPELKITKGITGSDNTNANLSPVTNPPRAGATNIEAGDQLDFTITVQNIGDAPGFDIRIMDELPSELSNCQLIATDPVKNKSGDAVAFTGGVAANNLTISLVAPDDEFGFRFSDNDQFTVEYSCEVTAGTGPGVTFENLASADWSLLSGGQRFPADTARVMMTTALEVSLTDPDDVCANGDNLEFTATPAPNPGERGVFTTTAADGLTDNGNGTATLNPALAGAGTYEVTYTFTSSSGATGQETVSVTINDAPEVTLTDPADACITGGANFEFSASPVPSGSNTGAFTTNAPSGFTDNGDGTATLNGSTAGVGNYEVTYTYMSANGCSDSEIVSVAVLPEDTLQISAVATCFDENGDQVAANTYYVEVSMVTGGNGGPYDVTISSTTRPFDGTGSVFFGPFTHSGTGGAIQTVTATDNGASGTSAGCESDGTFEVPEVLCGVNDGGQASGCFCAGPTTDPSVATSSILVQSQPGTFQTGGSSGQVQRYILVDASGNIVESNLSGLFSGVAQGTYSPYAINYRLDEEMTLLPFLDAGDPIQPILDGQNGTGPLAGLCFVTCNGDPPVTYTACSCYSVGSTVFTDLDNDGMFELTAGEVGIEGVTIELLDASGMVISTTMTGADGNYYFGGLNPGNYSLNIPMPDAMFPVSSTVTDNVDNGEDNDDNGSQSDPMGPVTSSTFELGGATPEPSGANETGTGGAQDDGPEDAFGDMTQDFGFFAPVTVGDTAFFDLNEDGLQTAGEPGVPGVTVTLLDQNGVAVTMDLAGNDLTNVMTNTDGAYLFDSLPPGIYSVQFDYSTISDPDFYGFTMANAGGDDATDSDNSIIINTTSAQSDPTDFLNSGEADLTLDVGLVCAVEVTVAESSTICSTQPIDLSRGASISPVSLGGTWSTPDGSVTNFDGGTDFATATTYTPDAADIRRGSVTLVLTTNEPAGVCGAESEMVTITIQNVDCGGFFWSGN